MEGGRNGRVKSRVPLSHIPSRFMCGAAYVLLLLMSRCVMLHVCACARVRM